MSDNTTELEVLDEIIVNLGGEAGHHKTVVPALEEIRDLLGGGGGGGGGYNPSLSVGRADALTGADETAQWAQRVTEGSGAATVRSVQGAAVGWNQLGIQRNDTVSTSGLTFSVRTDGGYDVSGTISSSPITQFDLLTYTEQQRADNFTIGHKYLFWPKSTFNDTVDTRFAILVYNGGSDGYFETRMPKFMTMTQTPTDIVFRILLSNHAGETMDTTIGFQIFDLTAMFGSGNEPSTVAEFETMYPEAYYPYSAPTLKPVQISGIRSTTAQGGELDAIEWETQTLRAAGSVRDELTAGELVTRVGVLDLGTLNWSYDSSYAVFTSGAIAGMKWSETNNLACVLYTPSATHSATSPDMTMYTRSLAGSAVGLGIKNSSYTDAATFKAAMSGVLLYYELATTTTTPISPALPMTYRVEQGGTESIIVPDGEISAAPLITLAEGESASELVMDALACIAAPDGPTATANHAANTYLTMGGKLYKVTSAIAVGETITPNTNVSETTVMAELIARTA